MKTAGPDVTQPTTLPKVALSLPPLPVDHDRGFGISEAFRVAIDGLLANKLRSFLTTLGIIIGVSAVIVMVSLGQGVANATREQIRKLGTNVLTVYPGSSRSGGVSQGIGTAQNLSFEDAELIRTRCPSVKAVSPGYRDGATVKFRNANTRTSIQGASPEYFEISNMPIASGRKFDEDEVKRRAKVAVLGDSVREELFGSLDPTNKYIKLNGLSFKVIGVVRKRGGGGWRNPDDQVVIPVTTALTRVFGVSHISSISVQAVSEEKMMDAQEEITRVLGKAHRQPPGEENVRIFNQADITESAAEQTRFLTILLSGIALVSLLVGGIGIMNIMLVSVTERTREIGIRKAVGAKRRDILYQFLIESVTLSLVGGLIGVALGIGVALWMAIPASRGGLALPMLISLPPIVVAFVFSAMVGIFFGIYPAMKASQLDPIEALRFE